MYSAVPSSVYQTFQHSFILRMYIHCTHIPEVALSKFLSRDLYAKLFYFITLPIQYLTLYSVLDVVGPPRSVSFHHQAIIVKKTLISTVVTPL